MKVVVEVEIEANPGHGECRRLVELIGWARRAPESVALGELLVEAGEFATGLRLRKIEGSTDGADRD